MRARSLILFIFGALSAFAGNSPELFSKVETLKAKIYPYSKVDLCDKDKPGGREVLLLIDIGSIKPIDSLYGFDYDISYNPEKIKFIQPIYIGTLSEAFEAHDMSIDAQKGLVRGFATTMIFSNPPVSGNKPLIGFLVESKSDCADTSIVKLTSIEFTEEFKKVYDTLEAATVETKVMDKSERGAEVKLEIDTITNYGRRLIGRVVVDKNAKFDSFKALFSLTDTSFFKFSNISAVGKTTNFEYELKADTAIINFVLSEDKDNIIYIDLEKHQKYTGVTSIASEVLLQNLCECVLPEQLRRNALELPKDSADTAKPNSVNEIDQIEIESTNTALYIKGIDAMSATIENVNGIKVKETARMENEIYMDVNDLPEGVYILRMQTETYRIKTKILLISNKQVFFN